MEMESLHCRPFQSVQTVHQILLVLILEDRKIIGNLEAVLPQVLTRISTYLGNPCEEGIDSPEWERNQTIKLSVSYYYHVSN